MKSTALQRKHEVIVHFFNIVWQEQNSKALLPEEVIMQLPEEVDIDREGSTFLQDCFGALVRDFSWVRLTD